MTWAVARSIESPRPRVPRCLGMVCLIARVSVLFALDWGVLLVAL